MGKTVDENRVALVTGVSSGIGLSIAARLAGRGFRVFGTTRRPESAVTPDSVRVLRLDVRDDTSVRSCVRQVLDQTGRIDALVNNAGYTLVGALEETSMDEARALFETNFFGVVRMTQAVVPLMREQRRGRIANIGSVLGFVPGPYQGIYSATKHALEGYSESLDHEVRRFGIRVSVIEPGFTQTRIAENSQVVAEPLAAYDTERNQVLEALRTNTERGTEPAVVAAVVLEALTGASPRSRYPVGSEAKLVGGLGRFLPARLFDRGVRKQFGLLGTGFEE